MGIENIRLEPILYQGDQENRKKKHTHVVEP